MTTPPPILPRVLVGLQNPHLRHAIAMELASTAGVSVVATVGDLDSAIRKARETEAHGVVIGAGLLRGDLLTSLRSLIASLPGLRVVIVGTETSSAYRNALEASGVAVYISLQWGADDLAGRVRLAMQHASA